MSASAQRIVVSGLVAQYPRLGGLTWSYTHYLLGLKRLGHDVYYLEDSGEPPYRLVDGGRRALATDGAANARYLKDVMQRIGLQDRWAYRCAPDGPWRGLSDPDRRTIVRSADVVLNVSGSLAFPQRYRGRGRLVYIDTDPVFTQVKLLLPRGYAKFRRRVDAHDRHFTFGETLPEALSATGHRWQPTRQPIVLAEWRPGAPLRRVLTTVLSWTSYRPLRFDGTRYAQKDVELKRFLDLPARAGAGRFEIAMNRTTNAKWQTGPATDDRGLRPRALLRRSGWQIVDAATVCGDPDRYRQYIYSSMAEWSVAKHGYVAGRPGWFSERSACYLAAGRPVVVQDTGFASVLPVGEGLLSFDDSDSAVAAVDEVIARYARHAAAARGLAETFFDSDRVLTRLLADALGSGVAAHPDVRDREPVAAQPRAR